MRLGAPLPSTPTDPGEWIAALTLSGYRAAYWQQQLDLAERIGARCCVGVIGSRDTQWDGPHSDNMSEDTFALIVDTAREIIDAVRPTRTSFSLEMMPWTYPDGPDANVRLIEAIGRPAFAVHLDPVNIINSPRRYYDNAGLIRECFAKAAEEYALAAEYVRGVARETGIQIA